MFIEDLMEKQERGQYAIITTLLQSGSGMAVKDVALQTGLSRVTLLKYVQDLTQQAQSSNLSVKVTELRDQLNLAMGACVTQERLHQWFVSTSPKYQILRHLYDYHDFTITKLSQILLLSEASLHRHLAGLNRLLEEFDLTIRGGRLLGSEHQIRYFYYQLFYHTVPHSALANWAATDLPPLLRAFETQWGMTLTAEAKMKLGLWLDIAHHRMALRDKETEPFKLLMAPYYGSRFYHKVRTQLLRYLSRYAVEATDEEAAYWFAFLLSMAVLDTATMERALGYGGPISEATTLGLTYLRERSSEQVNLSEAGLYGLNQALARAYFFQGALTTEANAQVVLNQYVVGFLEEKDVDLANHLLEVVLTQIYQRSYNEQGHLAKALVRELAEVFAFVVYQPPKRLVVGVDLIGPATQTLPIQLALRHDLQLSRQVDLVSYAAEPVDQSGIVYGHGESYHVGAANRAWGPSIQSATSYDLVISNAPYQTYPAETYYLKGTPSAYDIQWLTAWLQDRLES